MLKFVIKKSILDTKSASTIPLNKKRYMMNAFFEMAGCRLQTG